MNHLAKAQDLFCSSCTNHFAESWQCIVCSRSHGSPEEDDQTAQKWPQESQAGCFLTGLWQRGLVSFFTSFIDTGPVFFLLYHFVTIADSTSLNWQWRAELCGWRRRSTSCWRTWTTAPTWRFSSSQCLFGKWTGWNSTVSSLGPIFSLAHCVQKKKIWKCTVWPQIIKSHDYQVMVTFWQFTTTDETNTFNGTLLFFLGVIYSMFHFML